MKGHSKNNNSNDKNTDNNIKIQGGIKIGNSEYNVKKGAYDNVAKPAATGAKDIGKSIFNLFMGEYSVDDRKKMNNNLIPNHIISEELNEKLDNEKILIDDIVVFLNKLEFNHRNFNIQNGKDSNNISMNSNILDVKKGGKTNNMNNKCRKLDNEFQNFELI